MRRNNPTGWAAFRALRQTPFPLVVHRHGNFRHGRYSREGTETVRLVRTCKRMLRQGYGLVPLPELARLVPRGWAAYRAGRDGTAAPPLYVQPCCALDVLQRMMWGEAI